MLNGRAVAVCAGNTSVPSKTRVCAPVRFDAKFVVNAAGEKLV